MPAFCTCTPTRFCPTCEKSIAPLVQTAPAIPEQLRHVLNDLSVNKIQFFITDTSVRCQLIKDIDLFRALAKKHEFNCGYGYTYFSFTQPTTPELSPSDVEYLKSYNDFDIHTAG